MSNKSLLPEVATLELTYRCNHRCIFCSCPWEADTAYKDDELELDEWFRVVDKLLEYGAQSFTLTGGEPLVRNDLKEIIKYIAEQNAPMVMISNGRSIDDDLLHFISGYDVSLCISVPGIKSFEAHTGLDNIDHVLPIMSSPKC